MTDFLKRKCPGCGLELPIDKKAIYNGFYCTSPECWNVYTEVLGLEYSSAVLFGQVHQLTVDTYAAQHAGGSHPDKSIAIHLSGLHLVFERNLSPKDVPRKLQRLADTVRKWPHFTRPRDTGSMTVFDVTRCSTLESHVNCVREWASIVWKAWSDYQPRISKLVSDHLKLE